MNKVDLSQEIPIRPFGFNIPCRQFIIDAQVTRDKRMPMVDEFILRVLKLCEKVSTKRLTSFFGFSSLEVEVVLADLQSRSLVVVDNNDVALHPSALEMFRTAGDGPPQIVDVQPWVNRIWFDLISQRMIGGNNMRNVRNLIELKPPVSREFIPVEFAREAFQINFREYLKNVRNIRNPESLTLYAVTSVDPGRFSFAQIVGNQCLRYSPTPKIANILLLPEFERSQRLQQLTDAMMQALSQYSDPDPSMSAREEYGRLCGSDSLTSAFGGGQFLNLQMWLETQSSKSSEWAFSFVGCSYLEANHRAFCALLERSPELENLKEETQVEIIWFRPGGSLWGTSEDLRVAINEIRTKIRKRSGVNPSIQSTLVIPASVKQGEQQKRFGNIFDEGILAPGLLSPSLEVLLVRGAGAIISVLIPLSETAKVWIGYMTVHPDDLDRVEKRIQWKDKKDQFQKLWKREKQVPKTG